MQHHTNRLAVAESDARIIFLRHKIDIQFEEREQTPDIILVKPHKRSRGTPRLANRLLKRVRDFAQVKYDGRITYEVAVFALDLLEVDQYGLDKIDRRILQTLIVNFQGGPVGLETLAAAIGEDAGTLEDVYEPYLLQNGFLNRTPRGRTASALAYEHLGFEKPAQD